MKTINDLNDISGKTVLLRVDFNVPVSGGKVTDDFRIVKTLPTIRELHSKGAKIIIVSHFENEENSDFRIVAERVMQSMPISYCESYEKEDVLKKLDDSPSGIVLLSNLRDNKGEKANSDSFAKKLASLADIYVNEAFSSSHREHASIVGVPKYLPGYIGLVFESELRELSRAFKPGENSLFILGGAKFDTKMPLVEKFAPIYKDIFIGGALANTVFKSRDIEIGKSSYDKGKFSLPKKDFGEFVIPVDVVVQNNDEVCEKLVQDIQKNDTIFDAGTKTIKDLVERISKADFILWNGPLGFYEKGFKEPTNIIAKAIASSNSRSVIGGGDTVAMVAELGLLSAFDHISTGGGAMLDFLANGTLPGIKALE